MTVLAFVLLCFIWGSTWIVIKLGLQDAPPFFGLMLRFALAAAIVNGIVIFKRERYPSTFKSFIRLGSPGLLMFSGSYIFTYLAEGHINSALTAVLYSSIPIFVALLSVWLLSGERLRPLGWLGLASGFTGILLISYEHFGTSSGLFLGTVLAILGAFSSSFATVLLKRNHAHMNVFVTVAVQMLVGLIPIALCAFLFEDWSQVTFSPVTIWSVLYLSLIGTVTAFLVYYWLVNRMRAVVVSMISFIIPLVAIFIGVVFFHEELSGMVIPGTMLILLSVLLVILSRRQRKAA